MGQAELSAFDVISQRLLRLPDLSNVACTITIRQEGNAGRARAGCYLVGADGITYVSKPRRAAWQIDGPLTPEKLASIFDGSVPDNDQRTTGEIPLLTAGGGDLFVVLYGESSPPNAAEIREIVVDLVDASTREKLTSITAYASAPPGQSVKLPLVMEWQHKTVFSSPDPTQGWIRSGEWFSEITGESYFTNVQVVAAERVAAHDRVRMFEAAIRGLYSPEYRPTFVADEDTDLAADTDGRMQHGVLDFRTGLSTGTWVGITESGGE